jgi:predicted TPR repeat methyltransferase
MDHYKQTLYVYDKVARAYEEKFMDLDLYNDTYDLFCELLPQPEPSVFEIGCGPGNITRYLLKQRPGIRIEAMDLSPNMIERARANNPAATFSVMDCRDIGKLQKQFDGIMCGFCMPYLSREDCSRLFQDCAGLLSNDGIAYFSMIEGDYDQSRYETGSTGDSLFVYYHEEKQVSEALKQNGLQIVKRIRKPYSTGNTDSVHLILIVRKTARIKSWESCC